MDGPLVSITLHLHCTDPKIISVWHNRDLDWDSWPPIGKYGFPTIDWFFPAGRTIRSNRTSVHYGNIGCQVLKGGIQNYIIFQGNYCILWKDVVISCQEVQKSDFQISTSKMIWAFFLHWTISFQWHAFFLVIDTFDNFNF